MVDEESFVATLAPLAADPAVQGMIADQTMQAVDDQVDFAALTSSVFDGIAALDLPPAAVSALRLLEQPAADGLRSLVDGAVERFVTSDAFADTWAAATRGAHRALTTAATSDGGGLVVRTSDGVGIQLGAIVAQVKERLTANGVGAASLIPEIDRVIVLGTGENLALLRTGYAVAVGVGYLLPLVALALFLAGVLVARRRPTAAVGSGVGLLIGGGSLAAGIAIGAAMMASIAAQTDLPASALGVIYGQVSDGMAHTAAMVAVIGVVIAVLGWTQGASRGATAVRRGTVATNEAIRRAMADRGADLGGFGRWMHTWRGLVRGVIVVLAVAWLLSIRPLTIGEIILVLVVALFAWWIAELLATPRVREDAAAQPSIRD